MQKTGYANMAWSNNCLFLKKNLYYIYYVILNIKIFK